MILIIHALEDTKTISYSLDGVASRLVIGGRCEVKLTLTEWDAIRSNPTAVASLDGWAAAGDLRILTVAGEPAAAVKVVAPPQAPASSGTLPASRVGF